MRICITIFFALLSLSTLNAQTGNYFLSHYTPSDEHIDHLTFGMAQDEMGILYFANKNGVLEFDGRNWDLIPTPGPVYTVVTHGKDVFAGGFKGYGKLTWGPKNSKVYQSLSQDQAATPQVIASISVKDNIYFLSEESLFIVSATTGLTQKVIKADPHDSFTGLFEIVNNVYVGSVNKGLLKIEQDKLAKAKFELPGNLPVLFCASLPGGNRILIASATNRIFIFDATIGLREINLKDKSLLETNVMANGTWVNDRLIAIGTLRGGVFFINPGTGAIEEVTNFYTGLPDNEVYSILTDRNQGVWVAHDYGFTRIAPYLPFRSYSHYPGLAGNLLCSRSFNGQIYVGTTLGLFALVREEIYTEEPYYYQTSPKLKTPAKEGLAKGVNNFLSFFKRDKNKKKETAPVVKTTPAKSGKTTRKVLKSFEYVFKKVTGVEGKVNQLIEANGKLLVSGITGVLEVDGLKSVAITAEPVRSVFLSNALHQLLVSTLDDDIRSFERGGKGWQETHLLDTLSTEVSYIFEDKLQNIWLCGKGDVFKIETVDNRISDISTIPFSNPSLDEPVGLVMGSDVYVAASEVFNKYDVNKNRFERFDTLRGPKKYFASSGYFWFYDGRRWHTFDDKRDLAMGLGWLGLFQNIRFIAPAGHDDGLWVITASNELYRFSSNKLNTENNLYPLFLREVRGQQNKITPAQSVKVSQLESTVALEFIQPDYVGVKAIEYRYKVPGLNKDWSIWSINNNVVNFPYLPTGSYKVEVQSRDLLGKESGVEQVALEVEPPYWKQSWFYAAEFAFFSFLVILSLKLSSGNSKYRYISRLLSVLTVIMLIQFIQTIVSSQITVKSTPVIDFFIQVFIALLVLPIEGYLRKFMIRSGEDQMKTSHLWDGGEASK